MRLTSRSVNLFDGGAQLACVPLETGALADEQQEQPNRRPGHQPVLLAAGANRAADVRFGSVPFGSVAFRSVCLIRWAGGNGRG